jgi:uncharacterized protein YlzI (FlbEa/FlbD family)
MIRLTKIDSEGNKKQIIIEVESIESIEECYGFTEITTKRGWVIKITESPQEVARKVLEWRLAMERYRAYVNAAALDEKPQSNECWELAANAKAELVRLAGLEEPNHG